MKLLPVIVHPFLSDPVAFTGSDGVLYADLHFWNYGYCQPVASVAASAAERE